MGFLRNIWTNDRKLLAVLFLIALCFRIGSYVVLGDTYFSWEEPANKDAAKWMAQGKGYVNFKGGPTSWRPPGYVFCLSVIYRLFGYGPVAPRIFGAVLGAGLCVVLYSLSLKIFNQKPLAVFTSLYASCYYHLVWYSNCIETEMLFMFGHALIILFLLKTLEVNSIWPAVVSGILLGIWSMVKPILLVYPALIFLWLFWVYRLKRHEVPKERYSLRHVLYTTAIIGIFMSLVLAPWTIRNYKVHKALVPVATEGGAAVYTGNNPYAKGSHGFQPIEFTHVEKEFGVSDRWSEIEISRRLYRSGFSYIRNNLDKYPQILAKRIMIFWSPFMNYHKDRLNYDFTYAFILLFVPLGIYFGFRKPQWKQKLILVIITVLFIAGIMEIVFFSSLRFRVLIEPYIILLGSCGLYFLIRQAKSRKRMILILSLIYLLNVGIYIYSDSIVECIRYVLSAVNLRDCQL